MPDVTSRLSALQVQTAHFRSDEAINIIEQTKDTWRGAYLCDLIDSGKFAELRDAEKSMLLALTRWVNLRNLSAENNPLVWPSNFMIRKFAGIKVSSAYVAMRDLIAKGFVRKLDDGGGDQNAVYEILPPIGDTPPDRADGKSASAKMSPLRLAGMSARAAGQSARAPGEVTDTELMDGARAAGRSARAAGEVPLRLAGTARALAEEARAQPEPSLLSNNAAVCSSTAAREEVVQTLKRIGFDHGAASAIADHPNCSPEQIKIALALHDAKTKKPSSKLGFLRSAIEEKWAPPPTREERELAKLPESRQEEIARQRESEAAALARERNARSRLEALPPIQLTQLIDDLIAAGLAAGDSFWPKYFQEHRTNWSASTSFVEALAHQFDGVLWPTFRSAVSSQQLLEAR